MQMKLCYPRSRGNSELSSRWTKGNKIKLMADLSRLNANVSLFARLSLLCPWIKQKIGNEWILFFSVINILNHVWKKPLQIPVFHRVESLRANPFNPSGPTPTRSLTIRSPFSKWTQQWFGEHNVCLFHSIYFKQWFHRDVSVYIYALMHPIVKPCIHSSWTHSFRDVFEVFFNWSQQRQTSGKF